MSDPPKRDDRTTVSPSPSRRAGEGAPPAGRDDATRWLPGSSADEAGRAGLTVPPPGAAHSGQARGPGAPPPPRAPSQGIQVGDVLNHIFEVKRFIARGGMGEVFEGCNVSSEERVAIKVMLPALAQDPNVIAMFRKEARTLTRIQHEALVQYRVLAQEPQLGVLYIVTEYIDGVSLADVLGTLRPGPEDQAALLRRLASGLRAAHALGAIHRDMSPDNVLLEGGRLAGAKIIDFGIAKDLDPGAATIVGDGFAGKLGYVAPEQLGDFGRAMGSWTDVYSLGLVMVAVAAGRDVQMGGTLVDAVDKRRAGVDLTPVPARLRGVLEGMLRPDPAERLRSMDDVLAALDRGAGFAPVVPAAPARPPDRVGRMPAAKPVLIAAGAGAAALAIVAAAFFLSRPGVPPATPRPAPTRAAAPTVAGPASPAEAARAAIERALPPVACSWLDIADLREAGGRLQVRMTGVADVPPRAQAEISRALSGAGIPAVDMDFSEVAQIQTAGCSALDAFRAIRAPGGGRLSVPQRTFEIEPIADQDYPRASRPVVEVSIGDPGKDFALAGIDPTGEITPQILGRAALGEAVRSSKKGEPVADLGEDRFRITSIVDQVGWSGYLLITGNGPFEPGLLAPPASARTPEWRQRFLAAARRGHWQAEMVWFKSVDDRPG
ncbi:MAG: serine/threonine protein kinase [Alphaproteobacteria bacterium]|nr:serine/threonine protein kinase [Alphaproteobacteria bacterium]